MINLRQVRYKKIIDIEFMTVQQALDYAALEIVTLSAYPIHLSGTEVVGIPGHRDSYAFDEIRLRSELMAMGINLNELERVKEEHQSLLPLEE